MLMLTASWILTVDFNVIANAIMNYPISFYKNQACSLQPLLLVWRELYDVTSYKKEFNICCELKEG